MMISKKVDQNKLNISDIFHNTSDLIIHEFETNFGIRAIACYIEGLIDKNLMDRDVLKPLISGLNKPKNIKKIIFVSQVKEMDSMEDIATQLNYGKVALFFEGNNMGYTIELNQWEKRAVEEPNLGAVVRGPKEGFIEDIVTNKSLLRRKIRSSNLIFEDYTLGKQTNTQISLAYIKGIVNENVLKEVRKRLGGIDIDSILESGYIEELIEDSPLSLFTTVSNIEKPDVVAGKILEGRVAIFVDGTPHVLTVPRLIVEGFMTSEDYYLRPYFASFLRILRVISLILTIYLPGVFVALQLYHQEMIPTVLLISMAGAREGVPLPVVLETLLMIIVLSLIKESGLRLPKNFGSTVGIVGALILGESAVRAGIVSGVTIIIVSIVAISEFIIPEMVQSIALYRIIILLLGSFAGLYGITCGFMVITAQIVSIDSFGVPYLWPLAPMDWQGTKKDVFVRAPLWRNIFRPRAIERRNIKRQTPPWGK